MPKSLFYKIYFSVIIAFALLLTIGLILLSGWLGNYEASKPEKIDESINENHLATGKITELRDEFFLELSPFESNENIKPFYEENLKTQNIRNNFSCFRHSFCNCRFILQPHAISLL